MIKKKKYDVTIYNLYGIPSVEYMEYVEYMTSMGHMEYMITKSFMVKTDSPSKAAKYATAKYFKKTDVRKNKKTQYKVHVEYDMKTVHVSRDYVYTRTKLPKPKVINKFNIQVEYETTLKFTQASSTKL